MTKRTKAATASKSVHRGCVELSNEEIRQLVKGIELFLKERLPRQPGLDLQVRRQSLKFALAPVEAEHDRLVMLYVKRDGKKQPVRTDDGVGFVVDARNVGKFASETAALWETKQCVRIEKLKRSAIPERVDGKPFIVEGVAWTFLAPILTD